MRKSILTPATLDSNPIEDVGWLPLQELAQVEVTSEDNHHPIEDAFTLGRTGGWRASSPGKQTIRLIFDQPRLIERVYLKFSETDVTRTQQFELRWSANGAGPFTEIVRQQWNFSPQGAMTEAEDYRPNLKNVLVLELTINPNISGGDAIATLADWRVK